MKRNIVASIGMLSVLFVANDSFSMDRPTRHQSSKQVYPTRIPVMKFDGAGVFCNVEYDINTGLFSSFDLYAALERALRTKVGKFTIFATGNDFPRTKELSKTVEEFFPIYVLDSAARGYNTFVFSENQ